MNVVAKLQNFKWKVFWQRYRAHVAAIGTAVLIWFSVVSNGTYEYEVNIPIEVPTLHSHLAITSELPSQATIRVRGQGLALLALILFRESKIELKVDAEIGEKIVYPSAEDVLLMGSAKNLSVLQVVEPAEIRMRIEPVATRTLPVKNRLQIKVAPGYTIVGGISISPDKVSIRGGESLIAKIDSVSTEDLIFRNVTKPISKQLHLLKPITDDRIVLSPDRILIKADVQKLMEKKITNIPITVTNLPPGMQAMVIPPQLSLVAEGGVNVVANLTEKDIIAYIDYRRYQEQNAADSPAYLQPIAGVRYRDIDPKRFKVILEKK